MQLFLIIVLSAIAVVFVLVAFIFLLRCTRRKEAAPFPAVQPLAHLRQQQHLQQSTPQVYTSADNLLSIPATPSAHSHSATSLLSPEGSPSPSRRPSRSSSHLRPASTRPPSVASSSRGPPHSRHSPVQIVMPAPLAANIDQSRVVLVDQWAQNPLQSVSRQQSTGSQEAGRRRSRSRSRTRTNSQERPSPPLGSPPEPVPPVPRIPSFYTPEDAQRGRPARSQRMPDIP